MPKYEVTIPLVPTATYPKEHAMRPKNVIGLALFCAAALAALAFASRNATEPKPPDRKREARFYTGVAEAPVRSRSPLAGPHARLKLPPALQGDVVEHTLTVSNPTGAPLTLSNPKSCCGLIVTHVTSPIPPGEEGTVSVAILTDKLGGKTLQGYVQVETTDPQRPLLRVDATMEVAKVADISHHKLILAGDGDTPIHATATVTPTAAYPFTITGIKAKKGLHIACNYKEVTDTQGTRYLIEVTNTQKEAGVYRDTLFLQTDNPARPELRLRVEGHIE